MKNEISLQKISGRISQGMLLSILVMGSAWSAGITSLATDKVQGQAPTMSVGRIQAETDGAPVDSSLVMEITGDTWKFNDVDGDVEDGTLYEWFAEGEGEALQSLPVSDANAKKYKITTTDLDKKIYLSVTPKTSLKLTEPSVGTAVRSNSVAIMKGAHLISVSITNETNATRKNPFVNDVLLAKPICAGICAADNEYEWQAQTRDANTGDPATPESWTAIANSNSSTYTVAKGLQKLKIRVVVKNNTTTAAEAGVAAPTAKAKTKVTQ
jgi:hypothetical protein